MVRTAIMYLDCMRKRWIVAFETSGETTRAIETGTQWKYSHTYEIKNIQMIDGDDAKSRIMVAATLPVQ